MTNSQHHNHKHDHKHDHEIPQRSPFALPFFLILIFAIIELLGGMWTNSLALLSDAWHMFFDALALGLAWIAAHLSAKPGTHKHASGQSHLEIAAAAINALFMLIVVGYIIVEAIQRFNNPQPVSSGFAMLLAFAGLVVNIMVAKMLHGGDTVDDNHPDNHTHQKTPDHNKRAAYLHVLGDLLGSVAALLAGGIIYFTGWLQADPLLSIVISLLLLFVTSKLLIDIWHSYKNG